MEAAVCRLLTCAWLLTASWLLAGCEKAVFDDGDTANEQRHNVVLSVNGYEALKGNARSTSDLTEVCSQLNFVVYRNGSKHKAINQKKGEKDFGRVELTLDEGDYDVLVLGHSSEGKDSPTTSNIEKIQFSNITESGNGTGYSDTFYTLDYISVGDEPLSRSFTLRRAVAMFRLVTADVKPTEVKKVWFRYTGGSGHMNAYTGYGVTNSIQVVTIDTPSEQDGQSQQFEIYTFPHDETDVLKIQVAALNARGDILYERTFENVPIERNAITQYTGTLFVNTYEEDDPDEPVTPGDPDDPDNPDDPDDPDDPTTPSDPEEPETPGASANTFKVETAWASTKYYTF